MNIRSTHFLIGIFLILIGLFFLLSTLGHIHLYEEYAMAIVFFTAGLVLLIAYFIFEEKTWKIILGGIGIFIGSAIFIDTTRILPDDTIGALFFMITGLIFLNALRGGKKNWWAVIPGGFCFVMAAHVLIDLYWWIPDGYHGVVFFGGSGLIFGIIYLLKDQTYNLDWAKFPSMISFAIAALVVIATDFRDVFSRLIFPLLLIGVGSFVLYRSIKKQEEQQKTSKTETTAVKNRKNK